MTFVASRDEEKLSKKRKGTVSRGTSGEGRPADSL